MTVSAGSPRRVAATFPPIPLRSRLYGLGSIYGKTIRDSRLALLIVSGVFAGMMLAAGAAVGQMFPTPASRTAIDVIVGGIPASMAGLFGRPVDVGTFGGMTNWKYAPFFALGAGLWSILALSGTLAGESRRGSLDLLAAAPFGKRRVALEKVAAHLTMMGISMAVLALASWAAAAIFGDASLGDAVPPDAAIGFALWVGLLGLAFGGLAFALGPLLGRAGAAGVAGAWMVGGWVANGYAALDPIATLSPFRWTAGHIALTGRFDWPSLALVGLVALVLLALGVELFARRDLGVTVGLSAPGLPAATLGVRDPGRRAFGDQLPGALGWGLGLGLFGLLIASLVGSLAAEIAKEPYFRDLMGALMPQFDASTAGGLLQAYAQILFIIAGFAGATFVAKWASDETEGRLEMLLATPLARARWVVAGGVGALAAAVVMTVIFAVGIGVGAASADVAATTAMAGSAALGLYAMAVIGVGVAVGGLWRTSLAAETAAVLVTATFLVDLLAPPLKLPDWVHQLALTAHMGEPMVGTWNASGVIACLAIAVGGILLGAWGMQRRDVSP